MLNWRAGLVLVVLFSMFHTASAQLGQLKLSAKTTDLLNGRLTVRVPAQGQPHAIERSIMAAPDAVSETTRIVIDSGGQRMVLMAYELFARTDQGFEQAVQKTSAKLPVKGRIEEYPLPSRLRGIAYFPVTPTHNEEANLVMGIYVAQADGTVQYVAFYVNRSAAKDFNAATVLAGSMAKTIAAGPRRLNTSAGEREFSAYSPKNVIFATVPDGYVVTTQDGPDFMVHHVRKMVRLGETAESLGLYVGDHPSSNREGFKDTGSAVLFGKQAKWYEKEDTQNGETVYFTSAIVLLGEPKPQGERDMPSFADVFLSAGNRAGIEELKKIAATLRIGASKAKEKK
jgi:hypothetical protein